MQRYQNTPGLWDVTTSAANKFRIRKVIIYSQQSIECIVLLNKFQFL